MRIALGIVMLLHAVAHLVGFAGPWRLGSSIPYKSTVLWGHVDLGDAGIRAVGVGWLLASLVFAAAGVSTLLHVSWWTSLALIAIAVSMAFCVVALPDAWIGLALNVVLLVVVLASRARVW